jgi:hypothetical protein
MRPTTILAVFAHCVVAWPVAAQCLPVKVVAPDGAPVDVFGRAVSAGPYVTLVGADGHEHGFPLSGATYVYSPTGVFVSEFTGPENRGGGFGRAVATDGRLALVGAGTGWPRIYALHDNKVEFVQRLQTSDAYRRALGHAVALHADVAVIGSTEDTENGGTLAGAAFVFERDPNGVWIETAKLLADDGDFGDQFGNAVAIHSDVIVVGAWQDEPFGNWSGSAYVFERGTSGVWAQTARLLASDGAPIDNFGRAVATNGDVTLVGSPRLARLGDPGGVYVYERSGPDWVETQLIQPSGGAGSNFGHAVAVDQNLAVVGAFQHDVDGEVVVLEIDVQGAAQLARRAPDSIRVFVLPPTMQTLKARLEGRRTESEALQRQRLAEADGEIAFARGEGVYQHFITNDILEDSVAQVLEILRKETASA